MAGEDQDKKKKDNRGPTAEQSSLNRTIEQHNTPKNPEEALKEVVKTVYKGQILVALKSEDSENALQELAEEIYTESSLTSFFKKIFNSSHEEYQINLRNAFTEAVLEVTRDVATNIAANAERAAKREAKNNPPAKVVYPKLTSEQLQGVSNAMSGNAPKKPEPLPSEDEVTHKSNANTSNFDITPDEMKLIHRVMDVFGGRINDDGTPKHTMKDLRDIAKLSAALSKNNITGEGKVTLGDLGELAAKSGISEEILKEALALKEAGLSKELVAYYKNTISVEASKDEAKGYNLYVADRGGFILTPDGFGKDKAPAASEEMHNAAFATAFFDLMIKKYPETIPNAIASLSNDREESATKMYFNTDPQNKRPRNLILRRGESYTPSLGSVINAKITAMVIKHFHDNEIPLPEDVRGEKYEDYISGITSDEMEFANRVMKVLKGSDNDGDGVADYTLEEIGGMAKLFTAFNKTDVRFIDGVSPEQLSGIAAKSGISEEILKEALAPKEAEK